MISSKQLIDNTNISRATLNNYIALGLLPRPFVTSPASGDGRARQLGYFPDSALERVEAILKLKQDGLPMAEIVERLGGRHGADAEGREARPLDSSAQAARPPTLTLEAMDHPAYMLNYSFELVWFNDSARTAVLGGFDRLPPTTEERSVFRLLLDGVRGTALRDLLALHVALARERMAPADIVAACQSVDAERSAVLQEVLAETAAEPARPVSEMPIRLPAPGGEAQHHVAYASFFREGILFVYAREGLEGDSLLRFLSRRDDVIHALLRRRLPGLTHLAVMVADLQGSVRICSELPPEEYFELINQIWATMGPIFRKYFGTHGKHAGDGMVYYFFPQPDSHYVFNALLCAQEVRDEMRRLSKAWQVRKQWLNDLVLNIGLAEGQEWLGTFQSATNVEFAALGDTINHAARISDFARHGSIWATKSFLGRLTPAERARVRFGVRRRNEDREVFVPSSYALPSSLAEAGIGRGDKLADIAALPLAEIIEVTA